LHEIANKEGTEKKTAQELYDKRLKAGLEPYKYSLSPWTTPSIWSPGQYAQALEKPKPETVKALFNGLSAQAGPLPGLTLWQASAYAEQAKLLPPIIAADRTVRRRLEFAAALAHLSQQGGAGPFVPAVLSYQAGVQPQFMPVAGFLEDELRSRIEENLAQLWVNRVMLDVKKQLEALKRIRDENAFRHELGRLKNTYSRQGMVKDENGKLKPVTLHGLVFGETSELRNEYDIEFDDNLKPLRDSFDKYRIIVNQIEGRAGKPELLKESDFAKLFFGTEHLGVGPTEKFTVKIWPPYVSVPKERENPLLTQKSQEQRLFDTAEKPIIFWTSVKLRMEPREWRPTDEKMLEFVETQYRLFKARGELMAEVTKMTKAVQQAQRAEGRDVARTMRQLAKERITDQLNKDFKEGKIKKEEFEKKMAQADELAEKQILVLVKVAQQVENPDRRPLDPKTYVDYALPRGKVPFPRDDMVKNLLALHDLKAPLKVGEDKLDELNQSLFRPDPKGKVAQIQVLTNKPRSVYYIATVTGSVEPNMYNYFSDVLPQALGRDSSQNMFVDQVQYEYGREFLRVLTAQLRAAAEVQVSDAAKKQFDAEPTKKQP
jgi:hypothetical protein